MPFPLSLEDGVSLLPLTFLVKHRAPTIQAKKKGKKLTIVVEVIGYAARATCRDRTDQLAPFAIQSILILVAPALFAASVYMVLGRLVRSVHGERLSMISPRWMTMIFVFGDVFSFIIQVIGGGMAANKDVKPKLARNVILLGLVLQILMFGFFALTALIFHIRLRRNPTGASMDPNSRWSRVLWMMYGVSILILVRSVFRVIEYIGGQDGYLLQHEWTLYILDGVLMFLATSIFAAMYPGKMTPPERQWQQPNAGGMEMYGPSQGQAYGQGFPQAQVQGYSQGPPQGYGQSYGMRNMNGNATDSGSDSGYYLRK